MFNVNKRKVITHNEFNEEDSAESLDSCKYIKRNIKRQKDQVELVNSYLQKQNAQTELIEAIRSQENHLVSSSDWLSTRSQVELTLLLDSARKRFVTGFSKDECKEHADNTRTKSELLKLILDAFSPRQIEQFKQAYLQRLKNKCRSYYIHRNNNENVSLEIFKQAQQFRQEYVQRRMVTLFKAWLESKGAGFIFCVYDMSESVHQLKLAFQYWKNDTTLVARISNHPDSATSEFTYNLKTQFWNRERRYRNGAVFTDSGPFLMHYAECLFEYVQAHAYKGLLTDAEWVPNRNKNFLSDDVAVNNVFVQAELLALPLVNLKLTQVCDQTNCEMIEFQQVDRLTTNGSFKLLCGCQNGTSLTVPSKIYLVLQHNLHVSEHCNLVREECISKIAPTITISLCTLFFAQSRARRPWK